MPVCTCKVCLCMYDHKPGCTQCLVIWDARPFSPDLTERWQHLALPVTDDRVGDMVKFGLSTRLYLFGGPEELRPEEGLSKLQRRQLAALEVQRELLTFLLVCLSVCPPYGLTAADCHPSLPASVTVCLSDCLSACLSVCLSVCLHTCLSVCLPACLSVCCSLPKCA